MPLAGLIRAFFWSARFSPDDPTIEHEASAAAIQGATDVVTLIFVQIGFVELIV